MHLMSHDYFEDAPLDTCGLQSVFSHIAMLREDAQARGAGFLLLDNGDLLQGTPLADHLAARYCANPDDPEPHPVAQVMNALGYDAMGLGNHDFDYGIDYLARFARDLELPLISSNTDILGPAPWLKPSVILQVGALAVGVLSVLPARTMKWSHVHLNGRADIRTIPDAVEREAAHLRSQGAQLVIALAHSGLGTCPEENALNTLAERGDIDVLIGGHTHIRFPDPNMASDDSVDARTGHLAGVPTMMPGFAGEAVGCMDLTIRTGTDRPEVKASVCLLDAQAALAPPELDAVRAAHAQTRDALNTPHGHTNVPLTSYFAQVQPTAMLACTAAAKITAVDHARQSSDYANLPLLAAVAPERAGGLAGPSSYTDIPAGPLSRRQIAQMHIYPNDIWAVPITGAELRAWLEKSALTFNAKERLESDGLLCRSIPHFEFDVIFGVTYAIDPCAPLSSRITDLRYANKPVREDDKFLVATNSYRACGGGQMPGLGPNREMLRLDLTASQVMQDYIASGKNLDLEPPWRIQLSGGSIQTWFDTGPGAEAHLEDIANLSPGKPFVTDDGWLRVPVKI